MAAQPIDLLLHAPPPNLVIEPALEEQLYENAQDVESRAHTEQDQQDREQPVVGGHRADLAVSDRRDRDDGLVEGLLHSKPSRWCNLYPRDHTHEPDQTAQKRPHGSLGAPLTRREWRPPLLRTRNFTGAKTRWTGCTGGALVTWAT